MSLGDKHFLKSESNEPRAPCSKKIWTENEDSLLRDIISRYGTGNWILISNYLPQRNGKQCRDRWHNHLDPTLRKGDWTDNEDRIIVVLQKACGNQWSNISKFLPGRSQNDVKNRFYASIMTKCRKGGDRHLKYDDNGNPLNISSLIDMSLFHSCFSPPPMNECESNVVSMTDDEMFVPNTSMCVDDGIFIIGETSSVKTESTENLQIGTILENENMQCQSYHLPVATSSARDSESSIDSFQCHDAIGLANSSNNGNGNRASDFKIDLNFDMDGLEDFISDDYSMDIDMDIDMDFDVDVEEFKGYNALNALTVVSTHKSWFRELSSTLTGGACSQSVAGGVKKVLAGDCDDDDSNACDKFCGISGLSSAMTSYLGKKSSTK